jgi:hypothetical protein
VTAVTVSQGVAVFTGLSLDTAGTGYTLKAIGKGLSSATTSSFSVTPAPAARLAITNPPPNTLAAGSSFGLIVSAEDAFGNLAISFGGPVTIALATDPGGGVLAGTTTIAATDGVATFTGLDLDKAGNGYTLQVTSSGPTSVTTGPIDVTPTATQLEVTSQPPSTVVAGTGFGLSVSVADASGNLVSSYNGDVSVALVNDPDGGELGGTLTLTAVNGVATFSGLTINVASAGYILQATSSGLAVATTAPITVTVGPVPHLAIFDNPGPVTVGSPFQATVDVENSLGVTETNFTGSITLALARNPTGATLGGNLTMPALDGQATFYGLTLNLPGSGYTILATSNGFVAATASPITVVKSPPARLVVTVQPPARVAASSGFGLTVDAVDADGNLAAGFNGTMTVAVTGKRAGGKLRGTLTVTAVDGVATFTGLSLSKAGRNYTLRLRASGLATASTSAFEVSPVAVRRPLPADGRRNTGGRRNAQ